VTFETALDLLRGRALATPLNGWRLVRIVDRSFGYPGEFVPSRDPHQLTAFILLRTGRSPRDTLFTLCHEMGHFWSHSTGRRDATYVRAVVEFTKWQSSLDSDIRNSPEVLASSRGSAAFALAYDNALKSALSRRPNPLSEAERYAIVSEERRAWCFGYYIVEALKVPTGEKFEAEVNSSMANYCERVQIAAVVCEVKGCGEDLTSTEREFIACLTTA
jgi:hypothetical protein